ncbi:MAG: DUF92 domain-containing protein [Methanomassiliicoccaceae archaeon]|jgi:uncharacterized protein (TIGR00297 family)|nr:DUF92 domain-containing protein [Methanomassiliicoccaceae archaeon]
MELLELLIIIVLAGLLSILAQYLGLLTFDGAAVSLGIGLIIGLFGSVDWLLVLIIFTALGFAATLVGLAKKRSKGLQEGKTGERMYKNVVAVSFTPCLFAVLSFLIGGTGGEHYTIMCIAYISSITVAAADTIASEVGVKDKRVWLITTFKRVPPGTDGGVSVIGTLLALMAASVTAVIGWLLIFGLTFDVLFFVPIMAGMVGCFADSVVGATIEQAGYVSKYTNNATTAFMGALFAIFVCVFLF